MNLTWYEPQGNPIRGYNCYRVRQSQRPFTQINSTLITITSYTDTDVVNYLRYYYAVTAVFEPLGFETTRSSAVEVIPAPLYQATDYTSIVTGSTGKPSPVSDFMQFGSDGGGGSLSYAVSVPSAGDYEVVARLSNVLVKRIRIIWEEEVQIGLNYTWMENSGGDSIRWELPDGLIVGFQSIYLPGIIPWILSIKIKMAASPL